MKDQLLSRENFLKRSRYFHRFKLFMKTGSYTAPLDVLFVEG